MPSRRDVLAAHAVVDEPRVRDQVRATDLTEEVESEVDVGQPLALGRFQSLHQRRAIGQFRPGGVARFFDGVGSLAA